MQILKPNHGLRGQAQGHGCYFWRAWKRFVHMHVCAKYNRCSSIGIGIMNTFET